MIDLDAIKARCEAATPGPWEPGDVWSWAGVMPAMFGKGRCCLCKDSDPVWTGRRDINGKIMLAHKHRVADPYAIEHHISGPNGTVAGNYDYESGGILCADDLAFICAARTDVPALLDAIGRLRDMVADAQTEAEMQAAEVERMRAELEDAERLCARCGIAMERLSRRVDL